jgi:hypothetical protein
MQERLTHGGGSELQRLSRVSHGQHLLARVEASGHKLSISRHALARPAGTQLADKSQRVRPLRPSREAWD